MIAQESVNHSKESFLRNDRGSIAIIFAAVLVPVVMSIGIAIDYGRALTAKTELQSATDAAALAGASLSGQDNNGARQAAAVSILENNATNLVSANGMQRSISFNGNSITVATSTAVPTTLAAFITPSLTVTATSTAKFGSGASTSAPLCLLALNSTAPETFKAWGTADLIAPKCAVQSHSVDLAGMATGGSATATAAHFCSAGGHAGSAFSPAVEDKCKASDDPYVGKFTAKALSVAGIDVMAACNETTTVSLKREVRTFNAGGANSTYVFCAGLQAGAGATVEFGPGVYVFYGNVDISSGAILNAPQDVTFFFANNVVTRDTTLTTDTTLYGDTTLTSDVMLVDSTTTTAEGALTVQGGADFNLVAPTDGPFAGMAIVHPTVSTYTGGRTPALTHTVIGGGVINIVGTIYTPQAKVRVTGNGTINDKSTYFSIVADMVELEGNGQLYINAGADVTATNLPPMPIAGGNDIPASLTN